MKSILNTYDENIIFSTLNEMQVFTKKTKRGLTWRKHMYMQFALSLLTFHSTVMHCVICV
jgi:hypothetical protein